MNITQKQLRRIIKEEVSRLMKESRSGSHIELEDARSIFPDAMAMLEKNILDWALGADHSPGDFETEVPTRDQLLSESEFFIANGILVHWWDDMDSPYGAGSDAYLMWDGMDWINIDNASLDIVNQVRR
jgi:hypothetical protein